MTQAATALETGERHRFYEDVMAMLLGTLMVSIGIVLYTKATLLTSGAAGMALLLQFATGINFGILFFALNLPFYWLAIRRMGWRFAARTFIAVGLVSVFTWATPGWLRIEAVDPLYAAIAGGSFMGLGLLALFRHRTGLGGINILALYLQEHHGIRAGWFQLGVDVVILAGALFLLPLDKVLVSLAGAAVLNLILAINHKPGRYMGVS
ncbi:YitT family protein [Bosea psychrotolerans]|uniref:Putative 5xTM membrane YitT family protein n=1 Tax=Bosea psychrotolerans TaxID=1871628 RepID=A0A2S4MQB4_9HYPH|nr:YitT family protein [Bosea psychrotolerans]POR56942.1 putative 5xTM membrane YitT family protein [Bosea psychrotolerans]